MGLTKSYILNCFILKTNIGGCIESVGRHIKLHSNYSDELLYNLKST